MRPPRSPSPTRRPPRSRPDASLPPPVTPTSVIEVPEVGVPGSRQRRRVLCVVEPVRRLVPGRRGHRRVRIRCTLSSSPRSRSPPHRPSPTRTTSMVANWPDELSSEADLVADELLRSVRPPARTWPASRSSTSAPTTATIEAISDAWLAGLAKRDPTTPEFVVDLPDELWAVIDVAAADVRRAAGRRSVRTRACVTNVETPLTRRVPGRGLPRPGHAERAGDRHALIAAERRTA